MCTTGFLRLGPDNYLLFKNKDFGRSGFEDDIVLERGFFGVQGLVTWADTDPALDVFSGVSIGANSSGLLVCDSNVRTLPDHGNYDDLAEMALRMGTDVASGVEQVQRTVALRPFLWGNLLLVDGDSAAAVEVRGRRTAVLPLDRATARTNHHTEMGIHPCNDDTSTTEPRLTSAQRRLDRAGSVEDVLALLSSHDQGETGVCNHALYNTVYSYILHHSDGVTRLLAKKGRPCADGPWTEMSLPLGDAWSYDVVTPFMAAYPSDRCRWLARKLKEYGA